MGAEHVITNEKHNIYVLCDPDTHDIVYVGSTSSIDERFKSHIYNAKKLLENKSRQSSQITRWVAIILKSGKIPICKEIDRTRYWVGREIWWVKQFENIGYILKNTRKNAYLHKRFTVSQIRKTLDAIGG